MRFVRFKEQRKAAVVGEYAAQIMLDHPSSAVKNGNDIPPVEDMVAILKATRPEKVFTHNLADKHPTHIGVAVKVVQSIRGLPENGQPKSLYGCEMWRNLDWLMDDEKVVLDSSSKDNLQAALLGVFDSQISSGIRYDLATMGSRVANATYFASHYVDNATSLAYAMDLTPLIANPKLNVQAYVEENISRFAQDIKRLISTYRYEI